MDESTGTLFCGFCRVDRLWAWILMNVLTSAAMSFQTPAKLTSIPAESEHYKREIHIAQLKNIAKCFHFQCFHFLSIKKHRLYSTALVTIARTLIYIPKFRGRHSTSRLLIDLSTSISKHLPALRRSKHVRPRSIFHLEG